jgi:chemotaxis protein methyltransferase CheR
MLKSALRSAPRSAPRPDPQPIPRASLFPPRAAPAQAGTHAGTLGHGFGATEFARVRRLLHARAGIALSDAKQQMAYNRLVRRVRALGLTDFGAYLNLLEAPSHAEWPLFINALTTNVTSFFREAHHFDVLTDYLQSRDRLVPATISTTTPATKQVTPQVTTQVTIWCAGCSTGEEPYSVALALLRAQVKLGATMFTAARSPTFKLYATDIDTEALNTARAARYPLTSLGNMDEATRKLGFTSDTTQDGRWVVRPEIVSRIEFAPLNLIAPSWPPLFASGPFDAIFCRNVMIYFDQSTQRTLLQRFARALPAGGLLFAGHAEMLFHSTDLFEPLGRTVYRRVA